MIVNRGTPEPYKWPLIVLNGKEIQQLYILIKNSYIKSRIKA